MTHEHDTEKQQEQDTTGENLGNEKDTEKQQEHGTQEPTV